MNKANILSNELDQASKTHKTAYQHRIKELSKDIEEALDQIYLTGDEELKNRFSKNRSSLPLYKLNDLKNGETLALELNREKTAEKRGGRNEAPSILMEPENTILFESKYKLSKKINPLQAGEKAVFLLITKEKDPKMHKNQNFKMKAVEISLPGENALLPKGFIFEKELEGNEFNNTVKEVNLH